MRPNRASVYSTLCFAVAAAVAVARGADVLILGMLADEAYGAVARWRRRAMREEGPPVHKDSTNDVR